MFTLISSLIRALAKWFPQIVDRITEELFKIRNFLIAFAATMLAPVNYVLDYVYRGVVQLDTWLADLLERFDQLRLNEASSLWSGGGAMAAQVNAIVPLDFCLVVGGALLAFWLIIQIVRLIVWIYGLIPFKMS